MSTTTAASTVTVPRGSAAREEHVPLPRRVSYDWTQVPLHWVPGDPETTHTINTLHLFLPAGERWFVKVMKHALPYISDELLREQVRAFMSQEGIHATAHSTAADHLHAHGIDTAAYEHRLAVLFERWLGDAWVPPRFRRAWLDVQLAGIAAIEHYTAVLGQWILEATPLDEAGADETMLDLLRWHGAEEVEHRSVAFDLYQHLCGSYPLRVAVAQVVMPGLLALMMDGRRTLMAGDATAPSWRPVRGYLAGARAGTLPGLLWLASQGPRYANPRYHPVKEGDLGLALAYIASSPSHRRADCGPTRRGRRVAAAAAT